MTCYGPELAAVYDALYLAKPYEREAAFVHQAITRYRSTPGGSLLDLACGTGRHAVAFERLGWSVVGVDASQPMLEVARARIERTRQPITFVNQDMTTFDLGGRQFDAIVCLFDSLGYVVTNAALARALTTIRAHLKPGGIFACECWHGPAFIKGAEPVRVTECDVDGAHLWRISRTVVDVMRHVATVTYDLHRVSVDGQHMSFREIHTNRFFFVQELDAWMGAAGLAPQEWYPGFSAEGKITESTWHILGIAQRAE